MCPGLEWAVGIARPEHGGKIAEIPAFIKESHT